MNSERRIATPAGEARLVTDRSRHPVATLLLSHGAGNGIDTRDLGALARHLPRHGITVVRLEQHHPAPLHPGADEARVERTGRSSPGERDREPAAARHAHVTAGLQLGHRPLGHTLGMFSHDHAH